MAGPDTKLSQQPVTTDPTAGFMYIIKPDGGGGWESFQIAHSNVTTTGQVILIDKEINKNSNFTKAFDSGTKLLSVDFAHVSGSPKIKLGTTPGGSELSLAELPVPSGDYLPVQVNKSFSGITTIYISISGGTVNVNFTFIENFF